MNEIEKQKLLKFIPELGKTLAEKNDQLKCLILRLSDVSTIMTDLIPPIKNMQELKQVNFIDTEFILVKLEVLANLLQEVDSEFESFVEMSFFEPDNIKLVQGNFKLNRISKSDWEKAAEHLYTCKTAYEDIGPVGSIALNHVIMPLVQQYEAGERSKQLYDEIFELAL